MKEIRGGYGGIKWISEVMGKFGRGGIMVKLREGDLSGGIERVQRLSSNAALLAFQRSPVEET